MVCSDSGNTELEARLAINYILTLTVCIYVCECECKEKTITVPYIIYESKCTKENVKCFQENFISASSAIFCLTKILVYAIVDSSD